MLESRKKAKGPAMSEEKRENTSKTRSFRISDPVMEQFKRIQEKITEATGKAVTQDQLLAMFVNSYEMEQAKSALGSRETEISNFQAKINEIMEAFLFSLQLNEDAESRIRGEYSLRLENQEATISSLRAQIEEKSKSASLASEAAKVAYKRAEVAEKEARDAEERAKAAEATAKDKADIANMLSGKILEAERKLEGYGDLKKSEADAKMRLAEIERAISSIEKEAKLKEENLKVRAALEKETALFALEKKKNEEQEGLREKIEALRENIDKLKDQVADLKEQLNQAVIAPTK